MNKKCVFFLIVTHIFLLVLKYVCKEKKCIYHVSKVFENEIKKSYQDKEVIVECLSQREIKQ